jgi:hypothetical protein
MHPGDHVEYVPHTGVVCACVIACSVVFVGHADCVMHVCDGACVSGSRGSKGLPLTTPVWQ